MHQYSVFGTAALLVAALNLLRLAAMLNREDYRMQAKQMMRLFGSDRIASIMERMGLKEGEVIQHSMITRSVERAQRKVEENNYGIRKRLLEYDNVMNQQREVIYVRRRNALLGERLKDEVLDLVDTFAAKAVERHYEEADIAGLQEELRTQLLLDMNFTPEEFHAKGPDGLKAAINAAAADFYKRKEERLGTEIMGRIEKMVVLQVIDEKWKDHLREMDDLKEGIHLRAYGQKDPLVEYKTEAFRMFMDLLDLVNTETVTTVFRLFPAGMSRSGSQPCSTSTPSRSSFQAPSRCSIRATCTSQESSGPASSALRVSERPSSTSPHTSSWSCPAAALPVRTGEEPS